MPERGPGPKPEWLKVRYARNEEFEEIERLLGRLSLHTVCEQASCPNRMECYGCGTATFMILGRVCTRNCTFCDVAKGGADPVDLTEPAHVAEAVRTLKLRHAVITSVTRDDLPDGGAGHFAAVIEAIRRDGSASGRPVSVEVLIPDFKGDATALSTVLRAAPDVLNHNVETVPRLYPEVRPMADYRRSLELLRRAKELAPGVRTKSGLMVGLGEEKDEVLTVFRDLRAAGCDLLTVGQYLAPSKAHHPVVEFVHPDTFSEYRTAALAMGFEAVSSSPLTRSSYHAGDLAGPQT